MEILPKERLVTKIQKILQDRFGFDVYIAMKNDEEAIKRFVLYEGNPGSDNGFKGRIRNSIVDTIQKKFLSDDSEYAMAESIADNQHKFYVIEQDELYKPFDFLTVPDENIINFSLKDKDKADAVLFKFSKYIDDQLVVLWAYQKIQPSAIPNKKKLHFQFRAQVERPDVFEEMTDQMFMITQNVDLLVLDNEIITENISLLERHFGFEEFIRAAGERAVESIVAGQLVNNIQKLQEYVHRPNRKYSKKMMQIQQYPIVSLPKSELLRRIKETDRWKGVFEINENGINLRNFSDVEKLIDLFSDRYTKSIIVPDQEYDTSVKEAIPCVGNN